MPPFIPVIEAHAESPTVLEYSRAVATAVVEKLQLGGYIAGDRQGLGGRAHRW